MHFLRQNVTDLPISKKLRLIIVGISFFVATVVGIAVIIDSTQNTNVEIVSSLNSLSDYIAGQALHVHDNQEQFEKLKKDFSSLRSNRRLRAIVWKRADNTTEVLYGNPIHDGEDSPLGEPSIESIIELNGKLITIERDIFEAGKYIGKIIFYADTRFLEQTTQRTLFIFIVLLMSALLMSYALALRLEQVITGPITRLSAAVSRIVRTQIYDQRVERTSNDEVGLLIGGFNDMLDQIQLKTNEIHQARNASEELVQQLWEAKDSAEEAHLAKTQFLARMSHEIRTPINGVLGMVDLLMNSGLSPQHKRLAAIVRNSGHTLLHIINDLLDYAKIEANKIELENIPYNLTDVTEGIIELVAQSAFGKGIDIGLCLENAMPRLLLGDPLRLRQVLTNLLGNAVKFTEAGEVGLYILVEEELGSSVRIRFEVRDTGIGIPVDAQQKIFHAFSQADEQTTRRFGGTGLGLSIAWQLVALMGGNLKVESVEGQGSVFSFSLLQKRQSDAPTDKATHALVPQQTRILIIDNSTIGQQSLLCRLDPDETDVSAAATGEEGLQKIRLMHGRSAPFDVIMLNARLPDMDVQTFINKLTKQSSKVPHVLLLAPAADFQELEKQLNTDSLPSLTLPVQTALFKETLKKVLESKPQPSTWLVHKTTKNIASSVVPGMTEPQKIQAKTTTSQRILIAEDNAVNAEVARGMLVSFGYTVDCVMNGRLAVEALEKIPYDLILMDGQMPEMDGIEATRHIREREYAQKQRTGVLHHVPIIAATANIVAGAREHYLASGMNDFIAKPFSREDLKAIVARWIGLFDTNIVLEKAHSVSPSPPSTNEEPQGAALRLDTQALDAIMALNGDEDSQSGKEFLKVIVGMYCSEMEQSLSELDDAVAAENADKVVYIAHKIKSSSANMGAKRLAQYARTLEADAATARTVLPSLHEEYRQVQKLLDEVSTDAQ